MRLIIVFHVGHDKHCMDGHTDLAINAHCWSSSSNQYLHRVDDMPSFCNVTFGLLRQYAQCCCWSSSTWIASHLLLIWSVFIYQPSYHMWHGVRHDQRNYTTKSCATRFGFKSSRDMVVSPNPHHSQSCSFGDIKDLANATALDTRSNQHATVTGAEFTFCGFPCTDASRQNARASSEAHPSLAIYPYIPIQCVYGADFVYRCYYESAAEHSFRL